MPSLVLTGLQSEENSLAGQLKPGVAEHLALRSWSGGPGWRSDGTA
ncbi:hypothetical protein [Streptomyces sp. NPDC014995]